MIYKNIIRPTCFSLRVCRLVGFLFLSFGIASDPLSLVELSVSGSLKKNRQFENVRSLCTGNGSLDTCWKLNLQIGIHSIY